MAFLQFDEILHFKLLTSFTTDPTHCPILFVNTDVLLGCNIQSSRAANTGWPSAIFGQFQLLLSPTITTNIRCTRCYYICSGRGLRIFLVFPALWCCEIRRVECSKRGWRERGEAAGGYKQQQEQLLFRLILILYSFGTCLHHNIIINGSSFRPLTNATWCRSIIIMWLWLGILFSSSIFVVVLLLCWW